MIGKAEAAALTSASSAIAGWTMDQVTIAFLGVPLATVLMAFAGAVVGLTWMHGRKAWYVIVGAGTLVGSVCAPLVAWGAGMDAQKAIALEKALAFVLALSVQVAIPALLHWIERKGKSDA